MVRLPLTERLRSRRVSYTDYRILMKSPCPLSGVRAHGRTLADHYMDWGRQQYDRRYSVFGVPQRGVPTFEQYMDETVDASKTELRRRLQDGQQRPGRGLDDLQR